MNSVSKKNKYEIDMCNGSIMDKLISKWVTAIFAIAVILEGVKKYEFSIKEK